MTLQLMHSCYALLHARRYGALAAAVFMVAILTLSPRAEAQTLPNMPVPSLALEQVDDIKAQPLALLAKYPKAGPAMARYVAQALMREPASVDAVLSIIPDTSPEQAAAIGAGVIRAIRGLAAKQPTVIAVMTRKVMLSDNLWLKTTFMAIGPRGATRPPASSIDWSDGRPFSTTDNAGGGGNIGEELAQEKSRVGPSLYSDLTPTLSAENENSSQLNSDITRYGMIVALVSSDATENGFVSVSP
jgi:hypothetical protein